MKCITNHDQLSKECGPVILKINIERTKKSSCQAQRPNEEMVKLAFEVVNLLIRQRLNQIALTFIR